MSYFYSRKYIYKHILFQNRTPHGVFWCPNTVSLLTKTGNESDDENQFFFKREIFYDKVFWVHKDFYYFLATSNCEKFFIQDWLKLNKKFNDDNFDILKKGLNEKINNLKVKDIIDNYLIFNDYFLDI